MLEFLHRHAEGFGPLAGPLAQLPWWLYVLLLIGIVAATTVHEAGHAWMADRLGDPGPREQGRISLNPLRHFDWLGLAIMAVTLAIGFPIGWGKPLKTDPEKFCCGARKGAALVAAAGPLANLLLAIALSPLVRLVLGGAIEPTPIVVGITLTFLVTILINVSQFCFNLIPIHPMDGSHMLLGLLPKSLGDSYQSFMQRWGVYLFLVMVFTEVPGKLLFPLMRWIIWVLIGIQL
jgi:Zn-dependent protease